MSNDISLSAVTAAPVSSNAVGESRTAASDLQPPSATAPTPAPIVNPTLRLDAALGLVVIEFRNDSGAITTSIPSQRQLQEYQRWAQTGGGLASANAAQFPAAAKQEPVRQLQLPETKKR